MVGTLVAVAVAVLVGTLVAVAVAVLVAVGGTAVAVAVGGTGVFVGATVGVLVEMLVPPQTTPFSVNWAGMVFVPL
ncbi:hypothetical protein F8S13_24800 [Chloroflexia bacterium SDU3-3]|nr:hypothetical protein F8S13_24800 [Chloroflexia bacterium SDU3-3]